MVPSATATLPKLKYQDFLAKQHLPKTVVMCQQKLECFFKPSQFQRSWEPQQNSGPTTRSQQKRRWIGGPSNRWSLSSWYHMAEEVDDGRKHHSETSKKHVSKRYANEIHMMFGWIIHFTNLHLYVSFCLWHLPQLSHSTQLRIFTNLHYSQKMRFFRPWNKSISPTQIMVATPYITSIYKCGRSLLAFINTWSADCTDLKRYKYMWYPKGLEVNHCANCHLTA